MGWPPCCCKQFMFNEPEKCIDEHKWLKCHILVAPERSGENNSDKGLRQIR